MRDRIVGSSAVPDWLANLAALSWRVIAIGALLVALWFAATLLWTVTASIAVAIVIAAAFAPFALRLRARGRSRAAAAGIVWAVAIAVLGGVLLLLTWWLVPYAVDLVTGLRDGIDELKAQLAALDIPPVVGFAIQNAFEALSAAVGEAASGVVSSAAGVVTVVILAAFLVFFFLKDGDRAWIWIFQGVDDEKRERVTEAGDEALRRVGGYLRGTTILSAIIAATDYVFMWVLGVPLALPLAVLVFFSGYIPYFGGIVTTLLILLVTLGALGPWTAAVLLLLITVRNVVLGYGVRPALYGRSVSIHPALVLLALPAGYQVAGIVGLFAAVPVTAVILAVASATVAILDPGPRPDFPALLPPWLDRIAQWSWRLLLGAGLVALFVAVFQAVPMVVVPLVLATILTATLNPMVLALGRRGMGRAQAAAIAVGGSVLAITAIMVLTFVSLVTQVDAIMAEAAGGAESVDDAAGGALGMLADGVRAAGPEVVRAVGAVASSIGSLVVVIVLGTLLTFYFLRDGGRLWGRTMRRAQSDAAGLLDGAARRAFDILSGYMIGTGATSLVGAGSQLFIMAVLGIPLALPIFVLSFFLCFIPYIGGFISTGLALLVTIAVGDTTDIVVMAIFTLVFNIVQGNIVAPLVYGKTVHLHPAVVLVATPAGSAIAGILGMFLAVPVIGVVATTWRTVLAVVGLRRAQLQPAPETSARMIAVPAPAPGPGPDELAAPPAG